MLLKYILRPLASFPSLHAVIESQPNTVTVRFESVMTDLEHPSPSDVFAKIRLVLEVLQKQLLGEYPQSSAFIFRENKYGFKR
jgi:centromere/kinetochore protein ZW10